MAKPSNLSDSAKAFLDKYQDCMNSQYNVVSPFEIITKRDKSQLESLMASSSKDATNWIVNRIQELNNEASEANVPKENFNYVTNWLNKFQTKAQRMRSGQKVVEYFYNSTLSGEGLAVAAELEDDVADEAVNNIIDDCRKKLASNRVMKRISAVKTAGRIEELKPLISQFYSDKEKLLRDLQETLTDIGETIKYGDSLCDSYAQGYLDEEGIDDLRNQADIMLKYHLQSYKADLARLDDDCEKISEVFLTYEPKQN